jgi:hypothetical protein
MGGLVSSEYWRKDATIFVLELQLARGRPSYGRRRSSALLPSPVQSDKGRPHAVAGATDSLDENAGHGQRRRYGAADSDCFRHESASSGRPARSSCDVDDPVGLERRWGGRQHLGEFPSHALFRRHQRGPNARRRRVSRQVVVHPPPVERGRTQPVPRNSSHSHGDQPVARTLSMRTDTPAGRASTQSCSQAPIQAHTDKLAAAVLVLVSPQPERHQ